MRLAGLKSASELKWWPFVLIGFLCCCAQSISGQSQSDYGNFQVSFSPNRTIEPVNPGLELRFSWQYAPKLATAVSATYLTDVFGTGIFDRYEGYRVGVEQRWFFIQQKSWFRVFGSLEVMYHSSSFDRTEKFYIPEEGEQMPLPMFNQEVDYFEETFRAEKQMVNISPRVGIQLMAGRWLFFEAAYGFGVKFRELVHVNRQTDWAYRYNPNANPVFPGLRILASREGSAWTISIPVHFKIGFRF